MEICILQTLGARAEQARLERVVVDDRLRRVRGLPCRTSPARYAAAGWLHVLPRFRHLPPSVERAPYPRWQGDLASAYC